MTINTILDIGDYFVHDGKRYQVKGIHVYVTEQGNVQKYRIHIGNASFITLTASEATSAKEAML